MNLYDLVQAQIKFPGKTVRPIDDVGIVVGLVRREMHGPPDYLVMWSSNEITISRGYHLKLISAF